MFRKQIISVIKPKYSVLRLDLCLTCRVLWWRTKNENNAKKYSKASLT